MICLHEFGTEFFEVWFLRHLGYMRLFESLTKKKKEVIPNAKAQNYEAEDLYHRSAQTQCYGNIASGKLSFSQGSNVALQSQARHLSQKALAFLER